MNQAWSTRKYQIKNWKEYNQALKARGSLTVWFEPDMLWQPPATGKRGRWQSYSDAAIQCCLSFKVRFNVALRQTIGLVESLIKLSGLPWKVPDCSTLRRRQKDLDVHVRYSVATTGKYKAIVRSEKKRFRHSAQSPIAAN